MELLQLRSEVNNIVDTLSKDDVARIWSQVGAAKQMLREVETALKERAIDYMKNKGLDIIELSPTAYLQLQNKVTDKQAKPAEILSKLIDVTKGNADAIAACLASNAFKPATSSRLLSENQVDPATIKTLFFKRVEDAIALVEHNENDFTGGR